MLLLAVLMHFRCIKLSRTFEKCLRTLYFSNLFCYNGHLHFTNCVSLLSPNFVEDRGNDNWLVRYEKQNDEMDLSDKVRRRGYLHLHHVNLPRYMSCRVCWCSPFSGVWLAQNSDFSDQIYIWARIGLSEWVYYGSRSHAFLPTVTVILYPSIIAE